MTKFSDQLFDDLMREHGPALAGTGVRATPKRHLAARPVLLAAGAGGVAAAAAVGTLVASGGTPAYAVTAHANGTVSMAVYEKAGISQANAKLQQLGDGRVVVVPVESGCPSISSLRAPAVPASELRLSIDAATGAIATVDTSGIPAGDVMLVAFQPSSTGMSAASAWLTSGPVPRCISVAAAAAPRTATAPSGSSGPSAQPVPPGTSTQPGSSSPSAQPVPPVPPGTSTQPIPPGTSAQPVPAETGPSGPSAQPVPPQSARSASAAPLGPGQGGDGASSAPRAAASVPGAAGTAPGAATSPAPEAAPVNG